MKFAVIALLSLFTVAAHAEVAASNPAPAVESTSRVNIGFLTGMSVSHMSFSTSGATLATDDRVGLAEGGFVEFGWNKHWSFMPQIMYVQKGGKSSGTTVNYDTLELPLLIQGKYGSDVFKGVFFGGPVVSLAINRSATQGGQSSSFKDELNSFDIGVQVGGGFEWYVAPNLAILLNGRYSVGILDQDKISNITTRFNTFLFMTGMSFGL